MTSSHPLIIGVDEAGRGPWAGPVVAVAACFYPGFRELPAYGHLRDSKALSARARESIMAEILPHYGTCFDYGLGVVSAMDIDRLNIHMATRDAMRRAIEELRERLGPSASIHRCLIDGRDGFDFPDLPVAPEYVVRGDSLHPEIMLASIIAKTSRDHIMAECDREYPGYGFARHKWYGTALHAQALARLGPCYLHRTSFRPVREAMLAREKTPPV